MEIKYTTLCNRRKSTAVNIAVPRMLYWRRYHGILRKTSLLILNYVFCTGNLYSNTMPLANGRAERDDGFNGLGFKHTHQVVSGKLLTAIHSNWQDICFLPRPIVLCTGEWISMYLEAAWWPML